MTVQEALEHLVARRSLSESDAGDLMSLIMNGEATPSQIAGLLVALRMKGETGAEITGFARVMRSHALHVPHSRKAVVDTCGTGGDTLKTFNISTAAAIVAAAAGVTVAKHGNRAVTSSCGSADVLEALGVNLSLTAQQSGALLDKIGLAFLFAPNHHPAMSHAVVPRREMKIRTVFNLVGPLTNPAGADRQLIGVYSPALVPKIATALRRLGCRRGVVAHGMLGLDEVSPVGATKMAILEGGKVAERVYQPRDFGIQPPKIGEIACKADVDEAVRRFRLAISDPESPESRAILPSAGVVIWLGDGAETIQEGVVMAREAIATGAATKKLKALVKGGKA